MKKLSVLLFSLFLSMCFISCGDEDTPAEDPQQPGTETPDTPGDEPDDPDNPGGNAGKILIVYFSHSGNTAQVAGYIAELTGGDRFEIIPIVPYPDDYQQTVDIADAEHDSNARPAIQNRLENLDEYDTVFIGGPIWWGTMPMIIYTFYESYDLTGKTLVPFSTHAGSGLGDSERLARSYYPDNTVLGGLAVQGTNSANARTDVEAWLRRIGIIG